jgi:sugar O-acyltransferase (sialic acid O-acetyltransferase NeuD family)
MKPLVIFGASQQAELAHFYFTREAGREVGAFTVDERYIQEPSFLGKPVVAFAGIEREFPSNRYAMFIALGPHRVNQARAERYAAAQAMGYELPSYVSSRATVWPDLVHGPNTLITETSWVMPFVKLGANVLLIGARVGHHSIIGDHCTISGATLGGGVEVGERTFVGMNATVKERLRIGKRNVIGSGATILLPTKDDAVHAVHHTRASRVPSSRVGVV